MVSTSPGSVDEFLIERNDGEEPPAKRIKSGRPSARKMLPRSWMWVLQPPVASVIVPFWTLLRFSLSDASTWSSDLPFNYEGRLYNSTVDYFEDVGSNSEDDKVVKGLLAGGRRHIFSRCETDTSTSSDPPQGHKDTLHTQRRRKAAAATATRA